MNRILAAAELIDSGLEVEDAFYQSFPNHDYLDLSPEEIKSVELLFLTVTITEVLKAGGMSEEEAENLLNSYEEARC